MKKTAGLILMIILLLSAGWVSAGQGKISGRLLRADGQPVSGGMVYLYKESATAPFAPEKYRLDPVQAWDIDRDGSFSIPIQTGTYYLEAVLRPPDVGPPRQNEMRLIGLDNKGKPRPFAVKEGQKLDIGDLAGAAPYQGLQIDQVDTGITGLVLDRKGRPQANKSVFAFSKPDMRGQARFISDKTGPDGRYVLGLAAGGTYYLKALDFNPFPPGTFSIHGSEEEPTPVTIDTGTVIGHLDMIGQ